MHFDDVNSGAEEEEAKNERLKCGDENPHDCLIERLRKNNFILHQKAEEK